MREPRPWHLPLIGWLALIWMLISAADYVLTRIGFEPYLSLLSVDQAAFVASMPVWASTAWAVGVWAGLLGAADLVFDLRFSALAFAVATVANAVTAVWMILIADPPIQVVMGQGGLYLSAAMVGVAFLLWLYSRQLHAAGVLR